MAAWLPMQTTICQMTSGSAKELNNACGKMEWKNTDEKPQTFQLLDVLPWS